MSMLTCALSGSVPREPVISPYGHLYEKSVIVDWLRTHTQCPLTGQPLAADQLLPLNVPARPLAPTSLPDLLGGLTAEFNRLLEETWKSQVALRETREQLAVALYRVDAATRVVARLTRERDDLLQRLSTTSVSAVALEPEISRGLPASLAAETETLAQQLQTTRRETGKVRKSQAPSKETVENFAEISDSSLLHPHGGISALRLSGRDLVATAGGDLHVHVLRLSESEISPDLAHCQVLASLGGGGANVSALALHSNAEILFWGDEDGNLVSWRGEEISRSALGACVLAISVHPSGKLLLVATSARVVLAELSEEGVIGNFVAEYRDLDGDVTGAAFHPDGLLVAVAMKFPDENSGFVIFDVRSGEEVARLSGRAAEISDFRFAENGYMLVSADAAGHVILWDLRKSAVLLQLEIGNFGEKISVSMDESCQYIAVGTRQMFRVFGFAGKTELTEISSFETVQAISDLVWLSGSRGVLLAGTGGKISLVSTR